MTLLPYFKLMKISQKIRLTRIFCCVFFNFPWYLLVQSIKYLRLFEHVATFQFTICYNWSYYGFFNGKWNFNLFNVRELPWWKLLFYWTLLLSDKKMLITNMIWKELFHKNSLIMITRWSYLWILYKSAEYQLVQKTE